MNNTKEQQKAIDMDHSNIIVSAGAGSGKTAVLTQRVIRKIKDGVDITKLLVLTFTNEAASEMKNRIRKSLKKNGLIEQLNYIDSAYITTFDSFSLSLLKKYSYILNIPSSIKIIDASIIKIYKYKILDKIFMDYYKNEDKIFLDLINNYTLKDDKNILEMIINISGKLDLLTDKDEYLDNYLKDYYQEENIDKYINDYIELLIKKINDINLLLNDASNYLSVDNYNSLYDSFTNLINSREYLDIKKYANIKLPIFRNTMDEYKTIRENIGKNLKELVELTKYNDIKEIEDNIIKTKDYVGLIIDIIKRLDREVLLYKKERNSYEFNDISHMAISLVKNNPDIRMELKEYFNEIMIDEYQDTSDIQEYFISMIENNNVYMVGDIKQSIYRFRNANPYIFQDKYNKYSDNLGGVKIDLLKNFRSRNEVINDINYIFNLIMTDTIGNANYQKDHNMVFGQEGYLENHYNNNLEIYDYEINEGDNPYEIEPFIVASDIIDKINNKYQVFDKYTMKLRDVKYSDICIITDRNKYLDIYKKILEYKGIPTLIYKDNTISEEDDILVIKNLITLLLKIHNKEFDIDFKYSLTSILRSYLYCYNDNEIYHIINDNKYYELDIYKKLINIEIDSRPIMDILYELLEVFNVYYKLSTLTNIKASIIRIDNLLDIASNLSQDGYTLLDFINYLNDIMEYKTDIKYNAMDKNSNGVKIMNIHKSKGLEFNLCYFLGFNNQFTIKETKENFIFDKEYGLIVPFNKDNDSILKHLYKEDYLMEEVSEKIRLLYVLFTRCREKMIVVSSIDHDKYKYKNIVPDNVKLKYRSFLDIFNSIDLDKYIVKKDYIVDKNYDKVRVKDINFKSDIKIIDKSVNLEYIKEDNNRYSKKENKLMTIDEIYKMEYGTKIHENLEYSVSDNLLKYIPNDYINIYHEYEFIDNGTSGIIDLMIEYDNDIYIIDYKLKDISDSEYIKQLNGYRRYIESISDKKIKMYLYSILDDKLIEIKKND